MYGSPNGALGEGSDEETTETSTTRRPGRVLSCPGSRPRFAETPRERKGENDLRNGPGSKTKQEGRSDPRSTTLPFPRES